MPKLGALDESESGHEADISHVAARSFAGDAIDGVASGWPGGFDPLRGLTWEQYLARSAALREPLEFLFRTHSPRSTNETIQAVVYIDVGNDGVYADEELEADFALRLMSDSSCLVDLAVSATRCAATYGVDYPRYDTNLLGLVVDAGALGITSERSAISYRAVMCTDVFSGDVPQPLCDEAGDPMAGSGAGVLEVLEPPVMVEPPLCGGPWDQDGCGDGLWVYKRYAAPRQELLLVFPSAPPEANFTQVTVD